MQRTSTVLICLALVPACKTAEPAATTLRSHRMPSTLSTAATSTAGARTQKETTPEQMEEAFQEVFGVHPGERRNHAKGTCALGTFVGLPAATPYSRSAMFSGAAVPTFASVRLRTRYRQRRVGQGSNRAACASVTP